MATQNKALQKLEENYLFEEIARRKAQYPAEKLLNLGIGDTTIPLPPPIIDAFKEAAERLGSEKSYSGYESSFGRESLREAIATIIYQGRVKTDEIFISDGSKCDIARIQQLFDQECRIGIQDPTYPAYVGASRLSGKEKISFMPCTPSNHFYPEPTLFPEIDLFYLCSPNNPTGHVMNHSQLTAYVEHAKKRKAIILFDSAYSAFIQDPHLPRSIYEIEGAKKVALESGSFSKSFGFTGVRLGWLVVPKELTFANGASVRDDWIKIATTCFNGASSFAQVGGIAALSPAGLEASQKVIATYMQRARRIKEALSLPVYGGEHAPYLWVDLGKRSSWATFDQLLSKFYLVTTPGAGFGPAGEGFLRLSAFAKEEVIDKAIPQLNKLKAILL